MKPHEHYCKNCWFYMHGCCVNCDSPGDIRVKNPDEVCDGGGAGSEHYGFVPREAKRQ